MLKLISWNVNGLRACYDKGFADAFRRLDADFFCLQETKMQEGQLDAQFEGYRSYWNYAEKKGYSGTAVFSRLEPLSVTPVYRCRPEWGAGLPHRRRRCLLCFRVWAYDPYAGPSSVPSVTVRSPCSPRNAV